MKKSSSNSDTRAVRRIFLSGGLRSGWQDKVKRLDSCVVYLDPREHGLADPHLYTLWNLDAVQSSDLVFAFMERDNPSGFGLALEVGYARGIGKPVILVDERSAVDPAFARYFATVREAADVHFESLEPALKCLKDALYLGLDQVLRSPARNLFRRGG